MSARPRRDNAPRERGEVGRYNSTTSNPQFKHTRRVLQAVIALVLHGLWILDYTIENARQRIRRGLQ